VAKKTRKSAKKKTARSGKAKTARKAANKAAKKKAAKKIARKTTKRTARKPANKATKKISKKPAAPGAPSHGGSSPQLMQPPASGVKIRMYRHGHGDCFLLAFRGSNGQPVYVLIDCGYKPGSNEAYGLSDIRTIINHIGASTDNRLDLVIVTHEHQDHVNGFGKAGTSDFDPIAMNEAWFAWTESPTDKLAIELRRRYGDQLLGLVAARNQMAATDLNSVGLIDRLLSLELGVDAPEQFAAAAAVKKKDPAKSVNKQGMQLIKDKAGKDKTRYITPHQEGLKIPGVDDVRVYAFGPPHDADLLKDENPQGSEAYPGQGISTRASFFAAVSASADDAADTQPFSQRFVIPRERAFRDPQYGNFFRRHYGGEKTSVVRAALAEECGDNPEWRRIDNDWLFSAEELALMLNKGINNTSLVLAFELTRSKKVLLFIGDAQRGNWKSWTTDKREDDRIDLVRDLLARTVLYKVGHHGSHNATLNGTIETDYPCLAWMGQGTHAGEFTAMITAVNKWALKVRPKPWVHPLPSIKAALLEKAGGRVFQIDTPTVDKPDGVSAADWKDFEDRVHVDQGGLFFDYEVHD
jgi:beta-lactamase superfamily II metal-dependent hydrolase